MYSTRILRKSILILLTLLAISTVVQAQDATEIDSLQHDGFDRTYHVTVPSSYDGDTPVPLVIALHATGMSGKAMQVLTDFDSYAEENGFIVVYPNSISAGWNSGFDTSPDAPHDPLTERDAREGRSPGPPTDLAPTRSTDAMQREAKGDRKGDAPHPPCPGCDPAPPVDPARWAPAGHRSDS